MFPVNLDINECKDSPCHQNATCTDRPGYYNCSCNDGFNGNGFDCRGIIAIYDGKHIFSHIADDILAQIISILST